MPPLLLKLFTLMRSARRASPGAQGLNQALTTLVNPQLKRHGSGKRTRQGEWFAKMRSPPPTSR
jgi:hypothetical protein